MDFWKYSLDKTRIMVYNKVEHKMLFYLIPYGDWYFLTPVLFEIYSTTLSRTGIDTHALSLFNLVFGFSTLSRTGIDTPYSQKAVSLCIAYLIPYGDWYFSYRHTPDKYCCLPYPVRGLIRVICIQISVNIATLSRTGIDTITIAAAIIQILFYLIPYGDWYS